MMVLLLSCFSLSLFLCERTLQTNPNPGGSKMQLLRYLSRISVVLPGSVSIGDLRLSTALTPNVWLLRGHLREVFCPVRSLPKLDSLFSHHSSDTHAHVAHTRPHLHTQPLAVGYQVRPLSHCSRAGHW
ncbi:uncharacterized protein B0T23DRAFT_87107 [Neurospora hispaniola]|uniref:Secreted protein n=1 Tax=Neurospora hispaniola TaxID=588809 RepID=A0AAJ0MUG5_9PEZI|nr:hypothetical protein B0T23DRAFT_87107 [Neurospora hispaniola]